MHFKNLAVMTGNKYGVWYIQQSIVGETGTGDGPSMFILKIYTIYLLLT